MSETWGGVVPPEVRDQIDDIFPASAERQKIAYTLMFYNHRPSRREMEDIANAAGRSLRTVQEVIRMLGENNLFTTEFGSVPLYRHLGKIAPIMVSGETGAAQRSQPPGEDEESGADVDEPAEDEGPGEDADAPPEAAPPPAQPYKTPLAQAMPGVEELKGLRGEFVKMSQRQDRIEAQVDQGLKAILGRLDAKPLEGVVPVQGVNPLSVDPPDEPVEVEQEPVQRPEAEADEGPFKSMTKEQIIEMAINDPAQIYALRNQGVPPTSETIQAMTQTTKWVALELTTYTSAAYERACHDGYEGSLSDFVNNAVYKYFYDRGKMLDWVDVAPRLPPYYPQPSMYPRRPPS